MNPENAAVKKYDVKYLVRLALLCALTILMSFTFLGYLKIGIVEISFLCIPVIIAAIVLGPLASTVVGFIFGMSSFITCFGTSAFGAFLLGINPVYTFIATVVTRTVMGLLTGYAYKLFYAIKSTRPASYTITGVLAALFNTVLSSLCLLWLFVGDAAFQAAFPFCTTVGIFITSFVGLNGLIEVGACALLGFAIGRIVIAVDRRANKKSEQSAADTDHPVQGDQPAQEAQE